MPWAHVHKEKKKCEIIPSQDAKQRSTDHKGADNHMIISSRPLVILISRIFETFITPISHELPISLLGSNYWMPEEGRKGVFVTVGTTQFQELVAMALSPSVKRELVDQGFRGLVVQYGSGQAVVAEDANALPGLEVEQFALKPSILPYFAKSSLVISHGGSGSILEALRAGKPLIVVINRSLMDDHQTELAEKLAEENYLVATGWQ